MSLAGACKKRGENVSFQRVQAETIFGGCIANRALKIVCGQVITTNGVPLDFLVTSSEIDATLAPGGTIRVSLDTTDKLDGRLKYIFNTGLFGASTVIIEGAQFPLGEIALAGGQIVAFIRENGRWYVLGGSTATGLANICPIAIGVGSVVVNANGIAVGCRARSLAANAIALGSDFLNATPTTASGADAVAIGHGAVASGTLTVALGPDAQGTGADSVAVGSAASAAGGNAVAIGSNSSASDGSVVVGNGATDGGTPNTVVVGDGASLGVGCDNSTTVGSQATVTTGNSDASAFGAGALCESDQSTAIGSSARCSSTESVAVGSAATVLATAPGGVAIGADAEVGGVDSVAYGRFALSTGSSSVAIGGNADALTNTRATAVGAIAVGGGAVASLAHSLVVGEVESGTRYVNRISIGPSVKMTFPSSASFVVSGVAGVVYHIGVLPSFECVATQFTVALCATDFSDTALSLITATLYGAKAGVAPVPLLAQSQVTDATGAATIATTLTTTVVAVLGGHDIVVSATPVYGGGFVPTRASLRVSLENVSPGNVSPLTVVPG